ncbi:MAG: 6-bladed beta-propeller [Phycisphaerae bacterium]
MGSAVTRALRRVGVLVAATAVAMQPGCSTTGRLARDAGPVLFPAPPSPPRIAFVTTVGSAWGSAKPRRGLTRFLFGPDAGSAGTITKPFGLAAGGGTLLVCDTRQSVVHVFDFNEGRYDRLGDRAAGRLVKPVAVAMDTDGDRYVADTGRRQIVVFSAENEAIRELGARGDEGFKPVAIAVHDGRLYVANGAQHRVDVLDPVSGKRLASFGKAGGGPGELLYPSGLAVDGAGRIYVADQLNCRVQVFAPDGGLVAQFGRPGDRAGEFARPKHLAVGPDGIVYVVDAAFQRLQMFDHDGRVLMLFGGPGARGGSMVLPAGVCIDRSILPHVSDKLPAGFDAAYLVFVSDQFSASKVSVFAFGRMGGRGGGALGRAVGAAW